MSLLFVPPFQGRKMECRRYHAVPIQFTICAGHSLARGTPSGSTGHEEQARTSVPDTEGGPRAVPKLDGLGGSGGRDSICPGPATTCILIAAP